MTLTLPPRASLVLAKKILSYILCVKVPLDLRFYSLVLRA
jgi:hypothetical protein